MHSATFCDRFIYYIFQRHTTSCNEWSLKTNIKAILSVKVGPGCLPHTQGKDTYFQCTGISAYLIFSEQWSYGQDIKTSKYQSIQKILYW